MQEHRINISAQGMEIRRHHGRKMQHRLVRVGKVVGDPRSMARPAGCATYSRRCWIPAKCGMALWRLHGQKKTTTDSEKANQTITSGVWQRGVVWLHIITSAVGW